MSLNEYRRKRHFDQTTEPEGGQPVQGGGQYLIQKHDASHLHYDFRLELGGVLKSWAVPKGPSLDPAKKVLAVHVEDHPLEYGSFEGVIPQGEYGGGTVMLWDRGTWEPEGDAQESYRHGKLVFRLAGERLKGRWALIRMGGKAGQDGKNWLLKKIDDEAARSGRDNDILTRYTASIATGRTMDEIAGNMKPAKKPRPKTRKPRKPAAADRPDHRVRRPRSPSSLDPSSLTGARRSPMPAEIAPELPTIPVDKRADGTEVDGTDTLTRDDSKAKVMTPARTAKSQARSPSADVFAGVRLTHPDRVLFPDQKITKRDLAVYYTAVAPHLLPHIKGRPLSLVRRPNGSTEGCFYQKHLGDTMPEAVRGIAIKEKAGNAVYIAIDDVAGLVSLVQMGVIEIHPWACRDDRIDRPDRLIFDIDPAPGLGWDDVVRAAQHVNERLDDLKIEGFVRTTGGKGLHVVAPLLRRASWDDLKALARAFADALVRERPRGYIAQASKAKRAGKIYIDYLRNERGATAIASYSVRARPGATVATPLSWDELSAFAHPDQLNTRTVPERLESLKQDTWHGFFDVEQSITKAMLTQVGRW